ncbi:ATP phosphoribosyltransferase [Saccharopolyspora griseoalba]|uniref:ATP phosphoribosyltransferase n=1 Tax=Saccharopolyspora griseoalba TaxID=1431848 RepID=A0ABW2LSC6_9PSEU
MLRLAVPNKGSLNGPATSLLTEAGYRVHRENKALFATDTDNDLQFVFLRPMDIAANVGAGVLDMGITGQDLLTEAGTSGDVSELLELGFGHSSFYFATPSGNARDGIAALDGKRVATSFPQIVEHAEAQHNIKVDTVSLEGAVETAVELGLADAIADVVETGASLRAAGLATIGEPIMRSQAVLVRGRRSLSDDAERAIEVLVARLRGVLIARRYVMMDYNCPDHALDAARAITPGMESPTVSRLDEPGWYAVRAMVLRSESQSVMDRLWNAGARAILVTPLEACRL